MSAGLRRRIRTGSRVVSAGGTPGGGGDVRIGPDYGSIGHAVSAAISQPAISLAGALGVTAAIGMPAASMVYSPMSVAAAISATYSGAPIVVSVATATSSDASATSFSIGPPAGIQNGDKLVLLVGTNSAISSVSSTGFSTRRDTVGTGLTLSLLTKTASGESGGYTVNITPASSYIATMLVLRGAVEAPDVSAGGSGSATDPVAPTITTTVGNALKIAACVQANTLNADYTPPASYTEQSDLNGLGLLGALTITGEVATRPQATAGASGTATMDSTQALASNYAAIHAAFAPSQITLS